MLSIAFLRRQSSGIVLDQQQQDDMNVYEENSASVSTNEHNSEINSKNHQKKSSVESRTESNHRDINSSNHVTTLGTIKIMENTEL